jgi:hypothetical protein
MRGLGTVVVGEHRAAQRLRPERRGQPRQHRLQRGVARRRVPEDALLAAILAGLVHGEDQRGHRRVEPHRLESVADQVQEELRIGRGPGQHQRHGVGTGGLENEG